MPVRRYRLHGRVQGVGFRWWTRRQADLLGVTGTVRNEPDGSVAIVAAGDEATLRSFRTLLEEGPPTAHVDRIEEAAQSDEAFGGFSIIG